MISVILQRSNRFGRTLGTAYEIQEVNQWPDQRSLRSVVNGGK